MQIQKTKKIVVIGGGTGTFSLLNGLKQYPAHTVEPVAVVTMADSGGSTGRLRDEFGFLPVGDARQALVALAENGGTDFLRDLFLYRFDKSVGLKGHNFGNLLLVALTDMTGSEERAIEVASSILRIRGKVLPVTKDNVQLVARYEGGAVIKGEGLIDEPEDSQYGNKKIEEVWLEPTAKVNEKVADSIAQADLVVIGPGDLYTSLIPNLLVTGVPEALQSTKAPIAFVLNLMTKYGQTIGYKASDFVSEITRYAGRQPNYVFCNNAMLPAQIVGEYEKEGDAPIQDDLEGGETIEVVRGDFLTSERIVKRSGDVLKRSLIRHDGVNLSKAVLALISK